MKISILVFATLTWTLTAIAQQSQQAVISKEYRATAEKINDLVHTKLDARFDYQHSRMNGKEWLTVKPHFYPTDSLSLDAKGMDIHELAIVKGGKNIPLKYTYDSMMLNIRLDKTYKGGEPYTVYINYTAKPDEFKGKGSAAITGAKGLYFINPSGEDKNKPTEIWTQGETESNSVWIPIIDKPNQKLTDEISMTVPAKYVTLSNGKLVSQKKNNDGTRTDTWRMDLPHSPYLFFMGVGDYAIVKDKYKDKEVSYYVEKAYAPVARKIFGNTPAMIATFSRLTGVDYPWVKYSQIVGRDYVSGAMENTTATLHGERAQQDARELLDRNVWEDVISHELFHQWFGDLVTTESWSNITLNESMATIGSQLWNEFGHSKDAAYEERYGSLQGYLNSRSENKPLVRFYYNDREDVFDAVSYNKGGAILQMLRNYVGDSAFFKSLNLYLNTNKFKSAEAQQLRLAFEEVTGKDLNWFWNEWYYGAGNPKLNITYSYDNPARQERVIVEQTQAGDKPFTFPVAIDVWNGSRAARYKVWVKDKIDTFNFAAPAQPSLVNFDADKVLVAEKKDNKTLEEYLFQYRNAHNYIDRREAIDAGSKHQAEVTGVEIMKEAINDAYEPLRAYAINSLDMKKEAIKAAVQPMLASIAEKEKTKLTRAAAISKLGELRSSSYLPIFRSAINDSSYSVSGAALQALSVIDSIAGMNEARRLSAFPAKGRLRSAITSALIRGGDESAAQTVLSNFEQMPLSQEKFETLRLLREYLEHVKNPVMFKRGIDDIIGLEQQVPESFRGQVSGFITQLLTGLMNLKTASGEQQLADYVQQKLKNREEKKTF